MPFDAKLLGQRIKENLQQQNISQEKLAELLDKSVPMISYYGSGKRVPPPDVIYKIAKIFHVSADYLLGLVDEPNAKGEVPRDYEELKEKAREYDQISEKILDLAEQIKKNNLSKCVTQIILSL